MYDDLAFREYRIPFKGVALLAAALAGVYAAVSAFGEPAVCALGGMSVGYLIAQVRNK